MLLMSAPLHLSQTEVIRMLMIELTALKSPLLPLLGCTDDIEECHL